jgi:hypothetical protein
MVFELFTNFQFYVDLASWHVFIWAKMSEVQHFRNFSTDTSFSSPDMETQQTKLYGMGKGLAVGNRWHCLPLLTQFCCIIASQTAVPALFTILRQGWCQVLVQCNANSLTCKQFCSDWPKHILQTGWLIFPIQNTYGQIDAKLRVIIGVLDNTMSGLEPSRVVLRNTNKYWRHIPNWKIANEEPRPNQLLPNIRPKLKTNSKTIVINP